MPPAQQERYQQLYNYLRSLGSSAATAFTGTGLTPEILQQYYGPLMSQSKQLQSPVGSGPGPAPAPPQSPIPWNIYEQLTKNTPEPGTGIQHDFAGHAIGPAPSELQGYRAGWGPIGNGGKHPYEGQSEGKLLDEYEFDPTQRTQEKIKRLRSLEGEWNRVMDSVPMDLGPNGQVTEKWKRAYEKITPKLNQLEQQVAAAYQQVKSTRANHEREDAFYDKPLGALIPARFANAQHQTGSSSITGELGRPGRHGLWGEYLGGPLSEPDFSNLASPDPKSMVGGREPKEGETFNNILTDRYGSNSPFVIMHETGHAAWVKDLSDNERSGWTQLFRRYVKTDDFEKMPQAISKYKDKPDEAFASMWSSWLLNPKGLRQKYPDISGYFDRLVQSKR